MIEVEVGEVVTIDVNRSFCTGGDETVRAIETKYDDKTGEPYKVAVMKTGWKFDLRDGSPINPPYAYTLVKKVK